VHAVVTLFPIHKFVVDVIGVSSVTPILGAVGGQSLHHIIHECETRCRIRRHSVGSIKLDRRRGAPVRKDRCIWIHSIDCRILASPSLQLHKPFRVGGEALVWNVAIPFAVAVTLRSQLYQKIVADGGQSLASLLSCRSPERCGRS